MNILQYIQELRNRKKTLDERMKFISGMKYEKSKIKLLRELKAIEKQILHFEKLMPKEYVCKYCGGLFFKKISLSNHERSHPKFEEEISKIREGYELAQSSSITKESEDE